MLKETAYLSTLKTDNYSKETSSVVSIDDKEGELETP